MEVSRRLKAVVRQHSADVAEQESPAVGGGREHGEESDAKRVEGQPVPISLGRHSRRSDPGDAAGQLDVAGQNGRVDPVKRDQRFRGAQAARVDRRLADIRQTVHRQTKTTLHPRRATNLGPDPLDPGERQRDRFHPRIEHGTLPF